MNVPFSRPPVTSNAGLRLMLLAAGSLSLAIGVVGIVIPLLPTTPFLILAAICFSRSSTRCHRWLLTNRVFGRYLSTYLRGEGIPLATKAMVLGLLWLVVGISAGLVLESWWARGILLVVALAVTVHVVTLRPKCRRAAKEPECS